MSTVVCCTAKTEHRAQLIREKLRQLGYDECFEERIQMQELLISVRLHTPAKKALMATLRKAGAVEITTWEEQAA